MFVAVAIDRNNQTLCIAFGLAMRNNLYCCTWFLMSVFKYMRTRGVFGRTLQPLFWMTSNSYTVSDFEENFRWLTPYAREMLANIGHVKWTRAYFLTSIGMWSTLMFPNYFCVISKSTQCTDNNAYRGKL
uniref:Uncharacterized protein n=1 Tax=Lactuca sativa TaxID=4236 RepID=A0A9R1WQL9_LACSA|nr:hypothetical protein LSAT_V11C100028320 [Lactuca sativa]